MKRILYIMLLTACAALHAAEDPFEDMNDMQMDDFDMPDVPANAPTSGQTAAPVAVPAVPKAQENPQSGASASSAASQINVPSANTEQKEESQQLPAASQTPRAASGEAANVAEGSQDVSAQAAAAIQSLQQPILQPAPVAKPAEIEKEQPAPAPLSPAPQQSQSIQDVSPEASASLNPESAAEPEAEIMGIDTVNLEEPQGNWLFKRIWWERSEEKYEKARQIAASIVEQRMDFFRRRAELDKTVLDPFYLKIGLGQGNLESTLADLMERLESTRQADGALSAQERAILDQLRQEQQMLANLKKDVDSISKLDHDVDDALEKLLELMNKIRGYEQEIWRNFKEIARVLSDVKARELYYKINGLTRNISDVGKYLQEQFSTHFTQLETSIKEHIGRVTKAVSDLKEKGIDLKKQSRGLEGQSTKKSLMQCEQDREELRKQVKDLRLEADKGFISTYLIDPCMMVISKIVGLIRWPIDWIRGTGSQAEEPEEDEADQEQEEKEVQEAQTGEQGQ